MKTLLVFLVLFAGVANAQLTKQVLWSSTDNGYVTTAKTKVYFPSAYDKIVMFDIDHDTTAYGRTPLLCYAFGNDTANTQRFFLRPGETMRVEGLNLLHIYIWASTGTVPARVAIYR